MSKKKVYRFLSFLCALTFIFTTAVPMATRAVTLDPISDLSKYEIDGYTIQNVADASKLPDEFHGEGQNYGWSTTEYGDYIYIGTGYNVIGSIANRLSDTILETIPGIDKDEAAKISDNLWKLVFNEQLPDQSRDGHAILLKIHKDTHDVTIITPEYDDSSINGYRTAVVYNDSIYFVAVADNGGLVKVNPDANTSSLVYQPKSASPGAYRGLSIYDGELLFSFGTSTGAMIQASSTPEVPGSWNTIADEVDFQHLPSSGTFAAASGGGIWEMVEYNGKLYVSIATNNDENNQQRGFTLFRGDKNGKNWSWVPIIGDKDQGAKYSFGLGRNTPVTLTLFEYNGYLYLGEFNNTPYNLIMAASGDLKPLYDALNQPVNLYRMNTSEDIELVIGDKMEGIPGPVGNYGSGFDDHLLQYIWWMQKYDGKLFVGTFDISTLTSVLDPKLDTMTEEDFNKRLQQVIQLISSILEALGNDDISQMAAITQSGLEDDQFDRSVLTDSTVNAEEVKGYLSKQLSTDDLKDMLEQLIQLAQEMDSKDGSDLVATYNDLTALYGEKILPALSQAETALDPSLMPKIENISAILEGFFGVNPVEQFIYYKGIVDYTKAATMGYDIFYSADGVNFKAMTRDGFGHPESYGLRTFLPTDDALFFTTSGPYDGFEVWKLQSQADLTTPALELESNEDTLTSLEDVTATFKLKDFNTSALSTSEKAFKVYEDEAGTVLAGAAATEENNQLVLTLNSPVKKSTHFYVTVTEFGKYESAPVNVTVHPYNMSNNAKLSKLKYSTNQNSGLSVPGFSPDIYEYNVTLPSSTSTDADISLIGETADPLASITSNTGVKLKDGKGTAVIKVTAEDGTDLTYSIKFSIKDVFSTDGKDGKNGLPVTGGVLNPIIYSILLGLFLIGAGSTLHLINRKRLS